MVRHNLQEIILVSSSDLTVSEQHESFYYLGLAICAAGALLLFSVLVSGCQDLGGQSPKPPPSITWGNTREPPTFHKTPAASSDISIAGLLTGIALIIAGAAMVNAGRAGIRGSVIILDPQGGREDMKPWDGARGEMREDILRSSEVVTGMVKRAKQKLPEGETQIKIRCQNCRALNDEDARFCKSCGIPL
ncbi:hypothetical protein IAD21_03189 [Abditibacteriota bacterium]|nr:hypothetical protein IAD21_03189 [Abditibacteriota bacterium]